MLAQEPGVAGRDPGWVKGGKDWVRLAERSTQGNKGRVDAGGRFSDLGAERRAE